MKVAINTLIVTPTGGGGKTFLTNLVRHIDQVDHDTTYYLFVSPINGSLFNEVEGKFQKVLIPLHSNNRPLRVLYQQVLIPYYIAKYQIDVLLSYGNIGTLFPGCKQVIIVDGAQTLKGVRRRYAPGMVSKAHAVYFDLMLPLSLKRASGVITVSQFMKKELVEAGLAPEQKIAVVYEGIDLDNVSMKAMVVDSLELPHPYILFLSDLYGHKNADKVIQAFSVLKGTYGIPHKLLIVGRNYGNSSEELHEVACRLGVLESIIFTGSVPHEAVSRIYRHADVFVFPSAFESFGLPVLEAMACGTPVIGSNRTGVPEIIGDAGLIVDPDDAEALANAIYEVITDLSLRIQLIQKGYVRVREFTWEKAARQTVKVLEDICQK